MFMSVCMHVYVCMYMCICTWINYVYHIYIVHIYIMYAVYMYIYICIYIYMYIYICVYIYMYIYIHMEKYKECSKPPFPVVRIFLSQSDSWLSWNKPLYYTKFRPRLGQRMAWNWMAGMIHGTCYDSWAP